MSFNLKQFRVDSDKPYSKEIVDALWQKMCKEHIRPSRLFAVAIVKEPPTEEESAHLALCSRCRSVFDAYLAC